MPYRIAAVSFLNTVPLVAFLRTGFAGKVQLEIDLPSRLPPRLESGEADVALVPVVEIFRGKAAGFLGTQGIVADGPVDSVKLFVHGKPDQILAVQADRGSRTSVALARVLLAEEYGIFPEFREVTPRPGDLPPPGEATLVIGDRCFAYEAQLPGGPSGKISAIDLGAWWRSSTGLPFVFAAWAASRAFVARNDPAEFAGLKDLLEKALDYGLENLSQLAAEEARNGKLGVGGEATTEAIDYYFRKSLRFRIGPREVSGMKRFHELCRKHGIIPAGEFPPFL